MKIVKVTEKELNSLVELQNTLWKKHTALELLAETKQLIGNNKNVFFLAYEGDIAIGFAHVALRYEYVEGCNSSPTGYLEGIFVLKKYRREGVASNLVASCEEFAKQNGCIQFASDCELKNKRSLKFHKSSGFKVTSRNIHFIKDI